MNTHTLCVCVRVSVSSEISRTGRHSTVPLSPTWRASPGELQRLLLNRHTKNMWFGRKRLVKPCPSRYNGTILKKLVVFLKSVQFFAFNWHAARKKYVFTMRESLLKLSESFPFKKRFVGFKNGRWLANYRPPLKVTAVRLRMYYKLTGGRLKLFTFSRDAARKNNVLAAWEASLKQGRSCGI